MKILINRIIILILFLIVNTTAFSQYWKEITNIPAPYNSNYWLEIYISPSNSNYVWICGFNGYVIRTTDGGSTWRGSQVPNANHLESINFPTNQIGYVSGVEGIFKTTDGGTSWTEITSGASTGSWGCTFVNENYGMYVGDGCAVGSNQDFWLTDNGGASWSLYNGNEPNSGLTDVWISSQNGLGYAVSSGMIWVSTDGGKSWPTKIPTGTKVWHEELAFSGASFLVPSAGGDCNGGGPGGGMRFSTNSGASWEISSVSAKMYGAALLSETEGWAVGESNSVYYTNDAGKNWQLFNCGVRPGRHLDDIQFINKDNAWLVGQGVYKLAPTEHPFSKNLIEFNNVCIGTTKRDTLYIKNLSFYPTEIEISLAGLHPNFFKLVQPNQWHTIQPCDSVEIIVEFTSTAMIDRYADLDVRFYPNDPTKTKVMTFNIVGKGIQSTASPESLLLELNPAPVGVRTTVAQKWTTKGLNENIYGYDKLIFNQAINLKTTLPKVIWSSGSDLEFEIFPQDTGWTETKYKLFIQPCNKDTIITVRAYGTSPIIKSLNKFDINADCGKDKIDTIYIHNTGNANLRIEKAEFVEINSPVEIIGWAYNEPNPVSISPGNFKMLVIKYNKNLGSGKFTIKITNNDSTKAHGIKNPYFIEVNTTQNYSEFQTPMTIDFGKVCINESKEQNVAVKNFGKLVGIINEPIFKSDFFELEVNEKYQISVKPDEFFFSKIKFTAKQAGFIEELIKFPISPCNDTLVFVLRANVITNILELSPSSIEVFTRKDIPETATVKATSKGNEKIDLVNIYLDPPTSDWKMTFTPILNIVMEPDAYVDFKFQFTPINDSEYKGKICFEYDGFCPGKSCIDVNLSSKARFVSADKDTLDFGITKCDKTPKTMEFNLMNYVVLADTITSYKIIGSSAFVWKNKFIMPHILSYNKPEKIIIEFTPNDYGMFEADIVFETFSPDSQTISIHLKGEFNAPDSEPEVYEIDFGVIEFCQNIITKSIKFNNKGNIDDSLNVSDAENNYFGINAKSPIIIKSKDFENVEFSFDPSQVKKIGDYSAEFDFSSLVCNNEFTIKLKAKIIKPEITLSSNSIDFGNVWMDEKISKQIQINNNTNVDIKIIKFMIDNDLFSQISIKPIPEFTIPANQFRFIDVDFTAKSEGKFSTKLQVIYQTNCIDSATIDIKAEVPNEYYPVKLKFIHHQTKPGENLTIPLILESKVEKFSTDLVKFAFKFDKHLYFPRKLFVNFKNSFQQIDFNYSEGVISGNLTDEIAQNILTNAGEIMKIEGSSLVYVPDTTALEVVEFDLNSDKNYELLKENGSIKLIDYCVPSGALNRLLRLPLAEMNVVNKPESSDFLINLNTDGSEVDAELYIFNITGELIYSVSKIRISNVETELRIPKNQLANGKYFIKLQTENSQIINQQVMIFK